MPRPVKRIPDGYHTITPYLTIRNSKQALDYYKRAFNAEEIMCMPGPDGRVMHAEIKIGDTFVMISDEFPEMGCKSPQTLSGTPVTLHLYVEDVDKVFNQAVQAGATSIMPPQDQFWGDRWGRLRDPFGHEWSVASHIEDLSPEEIGRRAEAAMAAGCGGAKS